ncbi:E3 ubiquitin-protein ligase MARCH5 [Fragariocoptes setiger]|uniref:E3 ubiquitin-protein ligase MARCHF5 n=1 Tax=Fragariocoptes setiger TaxID=1670756 RepID=A0ABQ7SD19_9ACAR|nr:E3 ubiquitin-protein ligase MARCH5 [Fragariocoptes setiger]
MDEIYEEPSTSTAGQRNQQTLAAYETRQCWVCFGTDNDDDDRRENRWVCPCQCRGTMKWVHEECLQRWVDEKQKRAGSSRVHCSQCNREYLIAFPPNSNIVKMLERYELFLYSSSPFVAVTGVVAGIYWCCMSWGTLCMFQIMGQEEGGRVLDESDPLLLLIGLPSIPIMLVLAKLIKWEDLVLKCWRTRTPKIPPILSYILGEPPTNPRANCDDILVERSYSEPVGCARMICGALLLPSMASFVGKLLFRRVTSSTLQRSLLGGLTFLLIKGAIKIYLRKSQYIRFSQRIIKDYPHDTNSGTPYVDNSSFETVSSSSQSSLIDDINYGDDMMRSPSPNSGRTLFRMYFQIRSISMG